MRLLLSLVMAAAVLFPSPLPAAGESEASGAAQSKQETTGTPYELAPITVTATKREQKVKDIAGSISTASEFDLENIDAWTLKDATELFPNVYMKSTSSGNELVIRGFSTWDTALQSPAGLYVDGVPYPLSYMQNMYLMDLADMEVLRGPQGTLYGKNSESGVVNINRHIPDNTQHASVFTELGTYNTLRLGASFSTPLVEDKLYFSGSFLRHQTDGYVKNLYKDNDRAAEEEDNTGRAVLRWTPASDLDLRISFDGSHSDDGIGKMRYDTGPYSSDRLEVRSNADDTSSSNLLLPALAVDYTLGAVKLSSISSYLDYDYKMLSDLDRTPVSTGISDMRIDQKNFNQEFRIASNGESRLSWVAGVFLSHTSMETDMDRLRAKSAANTYLHTEYTEDTGALFGQATYAILENLRLTAGLRAEHTRLDGDQSYATGAGVLREYGKDTDYTELLPMASLSLDITPNLTSYATWSQGYLPGGFNVFTASNKDNFYYEPEYSTNYELGLKTNWLQNKLLANASVFYSEITDKQVREEDSSSGVGAWKFTNSAKAHSSGLELEAKAYPLDGLELRGGLGYAISEIDDWTVTSDGTTTSYDGKRLPWAPDLTYNIGAGYTHSSGIFMNVDLFGSGEQYFDAENTLSDPGYALVNLQLGYRINNWEFSIWGKNVFDEEYVTKKLVSNEQTIVEDGNPMTFGTTIIWRF